MNKETMMEPKYNRTFFAHEINEEFRHFIAPVSAVVGVFAVTGIFGNLFVLYVHIFKYKSCNFRYFVLGLCAVDLTASLTILPMEMYTQLNWYVFPSSVLCQMKAFLHVFLSLSTVYVLLLIAIDRHRKVCYPYSWQMTSRSVLKGYGICFILTCIQSWTVVMMFHRLEFQKEYHNTNVTVYTCTSDPQRSIWRIIYICAMVPHFLTMFIMMALYCLVGRQLFGYVMKMRQQSQFRKRTSRPSALNENKINGVLKPSIKHPEVSDSNTSSIIDHNLCKEINATTQTKQEVELVAYKVHEDGIMFEKGTSIKRKGSEATRLRMTFEEKKKMEERSTNHRVSRVPDDAVSASYMSTGHVSTGHATSGHVGSSKAMSTSEGDSEDRCKEESTTSSTRSEHLTLPHSSRPHKDKVTKTVSLAERLTTRVKSIGQKTVDKTKMKVTFSGKARNKLRRRTLITFVFTTIFIVTTIIYLVISGKVFREHKMSYSVLALYIFFYRLYFINSVIHPIIYGLLDPKFRNTLKQTTRHVIESVRSRHDPEIKE